MQPFEMKDPFSAKAEKDDRALLDESGVTVSAFNSGV